MSPTMINRTPAGVRSGFEDGAQQLVCLGVLHNQPNRSASLDLEVGVDEPILLSGNGHVDGHESALNRPKRLPGGSAAA